MKNRKAFVVLLSVLLMLSQMSLGVFADTAADTQDQTTVEQAAETEAPAKAEEETVTSSVAETVQTGAAATVETAAAATEESTSDESVEEVVEAQQDTISTSAKNDDESTETEPTIADGWTYDGDSHDLATAGSSDSGTYYYATSDDEDTEPTGQTAWKSSVPTATDAGTYYVWYRLGRMGSKTYLGSVTVAQATPSVSMDSWTYTYNPNKRSTLSIVSAEAEDENVEFDDEDHATVTYTGTRNDGSTYNSTRRPTEAGSYTATVVVEDSDNWVDGTYTATFAINRAELSLSVTIADWYYGYVAQQPSVTIDPEDVDVDVTYTYTDEDGNTSEFVWGESYPTAVGEYTLTASVEETNNYYAAEAEDKFAILENDCEHEWTVTPSEDGTSITAVCSKCKAEASVEISAEDIVYDATRHTATVTTTDEGNTNYFVVGTVYYYVDWYKDGEKAYSAKGATKAGNWVAKVKVTYGSEGEETTVVLEKAFEISKAELDIYVYDQSIVYGEDANTESSEDTFYVDGWLDADGDFNYDDLEVEILDDNLIEVTDDPIPVGTYNISLEFPDYDNYSVNVEMGELEVTPATLTIKAQDETIKYGKSAPKFTAVYDGFVGEDDESSIGGLHKFETSYSKGDDAGEYYIYPVEPSFKSDNYEFVFESATLTVEPADITVTWDYTEDFTYDGTEHTVTPSLEFNSGVILSDYLNLDVEASGDYYATDAGTYTAKAVLTGSAADNYTITEASETRDWIIDPAELTITWPTQTEYVYTGKEQTVTATIEGIVDGEEDGITATYSGNTGTNVGTYTATLDSLTFDGNTAKESNYSYTLPDSFTWYITPASLTITANDQTIYYGEDFDSEDVSYSGFVNGETETTALSTLPTVSSEYYVYAKPGTYELTVDGAVAVYGNYDITFVNGTLTVKDKVTTIVAKAKASGSRKVKLSWNKVTGADKYVVYMSRCNHNGKTITMKKIKTVTGTSFTVKKLNGSKLLKNTCYKFYVVAYNGSTKISSSKVGHVITGNVRGSYTNAKSIKAANSSVTVTVGGTHKVTATQKKVKSGKKLLDSGHASLVRFRSGNTKVATINENGVITGVSKGWCRVYVQSVDGVWTSVEVNVVE